MISVLTTPRSRRLLLLVVAACLTAGCGQQRELQASELAEQAPATTLAPSDSVTLTSAVGGPAPETQRFVAFGSSQYVAVRVFGPEAECEAIARTFEGQAGLAGFECELPLSASLDQLTIEFVNADGTIWELAAITS
jgi:hypothetical protein